MSHLSRDAQARMEHAPRADGRFGEQHLGEGELPLAEERFGRDSFDPEFVEHIVAFDDPVDGGFPTDPDLGDKGSSVRLVCHAISAETGRDIDFAQDYDHGSYGPASFGAIYEGDGYVGVELDELADWDTDGWGQVASIREQILQRLEEHQQQHAPSMERARAELEQLGAAHHIITADDLAWEVQGHAEDAELGMPLEMRRFVEQQAPERLAGLQAELSRHANEALERAAKELLADFHRQHTTHSQGATQ